MAYTVGCGLGVGCHACSQTVDCAPGVSYGWLRPRAAICEPPRRHAQTPPTHATITTRSCDCCSQPRDGTPRTSAQMLVRTMVQPPRPEGGHTRLAAGSAAKTTARAVTADQRDFSPQAPRGSSHEGKSSSSERPDAQATAEPCGCRSRLRAGGSRSCDAGCDNSRAS